ncbi:MAG: hypothetical protein FJW31_02585 [Acidobacteria bacterium]|nr:hypothetical protein [Acidobacteriota bacterium]
MTQPTANNLMKLETVLSHVNGIRPALQAALACPHCRVRLRGMACTACEYRLDSSHGVLQPRTEAGRNRFQDYST